jgi:hypothetical protein
MHRSENLLQAIYFGFDLQNLYLRLDLTRPMDASVRVATRIRLLFLKPVAFEIQATVQMDGQITLTLANNSALPPGTAGKIIEIALPLDRLPKHPSTDFQFVVAVDRDAQEQERWPLDQPITIPYPRPDAFAENWSL